MRFNTTLKAMLVAGVIATPVIAQQATPGVTPSSPTTGQAMPSQAAPGVTPSSPTTGQAMPSQAAPGVTPSSPTTGQAVPGRTSPGVTPSSPTTGQAMPSQAVPGRTAPGQTTPSQAIPSQAMPAPSSTGMVTATPRVASAAAIAAGQRASKLIGATVRNEQEESIGTVDDLIITRDDRVPVAVLSVGGFLGMGARLVAVPFERLTIDKEGKVMLSGATRDSLRALAAFEYPAS